MESKMSEVGRTAVRIGELDLMFAHWCISKPFRRAIGIGACFATACAGRLRPDRLLQPLF